MPDKFTHYLVMTVKPGYWGWGRTLPDALNAAEYISSGTKVRMFRATPDAWVDEMGNVYGVEAKTRMVGIVGRSGREVTSLRFEEPQD